MTRPIVAVVFLSLAASAALAITPPTRPAQQVRDSGDYVSIIDHATRIDANNLEMIVTNHGSWACDIEHWGRGLWYPNGSNSACARASGIWIGASVDGETRVTAASYTQEYTPGPIIGECDWPDSSAPEHKVYKIYEGMDTTSYDYRNWPSHLGAPVDADGRPLLKGTQTLWCVYNDADPGVHTADEGSAMNDPMGLEVQQTVFALNRPGALGNTIFMEFKILNRCSYTLEDAYVAIWGDPDIGGSTDDYVGCHPMRNLAFSYNADNNDDVYGTGPPCLGYDLLRGTVDESGRKHYMTSFSRLTNTTDPRAKEESYNYMMGFDFNGNPVVDPTTGEVTKYMVSGDPVSGTGWLDSEPGDRRFMMVSGPFTMVPGDSQEVALAIVIGHGTDNIESVEIMKAYDAQAQYWYRFGDGRPVFPHFQITSGEDEAHLTWTNPDDPGFAETVIRYSLEAYPEDLSAGLPVPNGDGGRFPARPGTAGSFIHRDLRAGLTYFYTAFAVDQTGAYRAISLGEATPSGSGSSAGVDERVGTPPVSLSARPNPARGMVDFTWSGPAGVRAHLTIYNTAGQAVRALDVTARQSRGGSTTWDGLDGAGRAVPAGIYFAKLDCDGRTRVSKIILIR